MSELDHAIATQRANLKRRRQWLRAQRRALGRKATSYCGKQSTLVGAFFAGMVLGAWYPPRTDQRPRPRRDTAGGSPRPNSSPALRRQAVASLQMLVVNTLFDFITRPRRTSSQNSSGSAGE